MTKIAIYPGTFDPFTIGHLDIVNRAAEIFDTVIIVVSDNSSKINIYEKCARVSHISTIINNTNIKVIASMHQTTIDVAKYYNCNTIIKGIRNAQDYEYEARMSIINKKLDKTIETVFMQSDPVNNVISSSLAKELILLEQPTDWILNPFIELLYIKKYKELGKLC